MCYELLFPLLQLPTTMIVPALSNGLIYYMVKAAEYSSKYKNLRPGLSLGSTTN